MYSMLYLNKNNKMWGLENKSIVFVCFINLKLYCTIKIKRKRSVVLQAVISCCVPPKQKSLEHF